MNDDRLLAQIETFKRHFDDNLLNKDGQAIPFDEAVATTIALHPVT